MSSPEGEGGEGKKEANPSGREGERCWGPGGRNSGAFDPEDLESTAGVLRQEVFQEQLVERPGDWDSTDRGGGQKDDGALGFSNPAAVAYPKETWHANTESGNGNEKSVCVAQLEQPGPHNTCRMTSGRRMACCHTGSAVNTCLRLPHSSLHCPPSWSQVPSSIYQAGARSPHVSTTPGPGPLVLPPPPGPGPLIHLPPRGQVPSSVHHPRRQVPSCV